MAVSSPEKGCLETRLKQPTNEQRTDRVRSSTEGQNNKEVRLKLERGMSRECFQRLVYALLDMTL